MMDWKALIAQIGWSAIRWALTAAGAALAAHGVMTADQAQAVQDAVSPDLQEALGAAIGAAALGWSAYQKHQAEQTTAAKEIAAAQLGTTTAERKDPVAAEPSPTVAAKAAAIVATAPAAGPQR